MTDQERNAMKMALDALDASYPIINSYKNLDIHSEAMSALRQTLAQPEPQVCCGDYEKCMKACTPRGRWLVERELAQPEQEPVAWIGHSGNLAYSKNNFMPSVRHLSKPLYTAPPSKPCEITDLLQQKFQSGNNVPVERVTITRSEYEAALRSKNNG